MTYSNFKIKGDKSYNLMGCTWPKKAPLFINLCNDMIKDGLNIAQLERLLSGIMSEIRFERFYKRSKYNIQEGWYNIKPGNDDLVKSIHGEIGHSIADHPTLFKKGHKTINLTLEPYDLCMDDFKKLIDFCENYGTSFEIHPFMGTYFPGRTIPIFINR
jgi:hypothetical protein